MGCIPAKHKNNAIHSSKQEKVETKIEESKEPQNARAVDLQKYFSEYRAGVQANLKQDFDIDKATKLDKWEALHNGILNGNLELCRKVLQTVDRLEDILCNDEISHEMCGISRKTLHMAPLNLACMCRRPKIILELLRKGADVSRIDDFGHSPVYKTVCYWPRVVPILRKSGENLDETEKKFWSNIIEQNRRSEECLRLLLKTGANPSEVVTDNGQTLLHICAKKELPNAIDILVEFKANLELKDSDGCTALLLASNSGQFMCVKKLLECGADISVCDNKGFSLLHSLCMCKKISLTQIEELIPLGILQFVNLKCSRGYTPLHMAARSCNGEKIKCLLNQGADANVFDKFGRQPLYLFLDNSEPATCLHGFHELVTEMTQICMKSDDGILPRIYRESRCSRKVRQILLEHSSTPTSLFRLSMLRIRHSLGRNRQTVGQVAQLPLPDKLKLEILLYPEKCKNYWQQVHILQQHPR